MIKAIALVVLLVSAEAMASTPSLGGKNAQEPKASASAKTKNKSHSFDSQTVEGEVYRPDYSVVTGDAPGEGWGVLRLRPNFDDHTVSDAAEQKAEEKKR